MAAGDMARAAEAITPEMQDEVAVVGSPEYCRADWRGGGKPGYRCR